MRANAFPILELVKERVVNLKKCRKLEPGGKGGAVERSTMRGRAELRVVHVLLGNPPIT